MRRILFFATKLAGASAAAYLGLLLAWGLWNAPRLLLTVVSDARVAGNAFSPAEGVFRLFVLPPTTAQFPFPEVFLAGPLLFGLALALAAPGLLGRLPEWPRLIGAFIVFWICLFVADALAFFLERGRGALADLVKIFPGPLSGAEGLGRAAITAMVGVLAAWALGRAWATVGGETRRARLLGGALWLAAPLVLLLAVLPGLQTPAFWLARAGPDGAVFWLAGLTIVLAALLPAGERKIWNGGAAGGLAVLAVSAVVFGAAEQLGGGEPVGPDLEIVQSEHWQIEYPPSLMDAQRAAAWGERADLRLERLAERSAAGLPTKRLAVRLTSGAPPSPFDRRRRERGTQTPNEYVTPVLTLDSEQLPTDPLREALILFKDRWGEPESAMSAAAAARYAVGEAFGCGLLEYARRIATEERPYRIEELLAGDDEYLSPVVRDVMSGAWVEALVQARGPKVVRIVYSTPPGRLAEALETTSSEIEMSWRGILLAEPPATRRAETRPLGFHKGISLSHEVGGGWGYGSPAAAAELERIRSLGADAVALVPYAYTRAPAETAIRFRTDETDARVVGSVRQAKEAGLKVALKPHLWGPGFTGDIRFTSDERFQDWFGQYRRWIVHFARLAELHEVDLLVIGNELGGVSGYEDEWRALIRDARRVYRGPMTYASHWDGEFEKVAFWDDLDVIGVNFYFPLAEVGQAPSAKSERVASIVRRLESVARRFDKRILFTEVGFPSFSTAAAEPWKDASAPLDLELQRACYEVVFEAFYRQPWLAGMYWWKWPSHGRAGPYDGRHYPTGKPAQETLRQWYSRLR